MSPSVVLADDHPVARAGLRLLVDGREELRVVGEAGDADDAVALGRRLRPDVLTLEFGLPGSLSTLQAVGALAADAPDVRTLMVTTRHDPAFVRAAVQAGAAGYVLKDRAEELLVRALRHLAAGGAFFDDRLV